MSVLLVAAKRDLIEGKLRLLTDAEVAPSIVDVDAFALHNAFELNYPDAMNGVVCLVNIGHEVTNINILDDGVPLLTRDIAVGTRRFREDLQRERGLECRGSRCAAAGLRSLAASAGDHRESRRGDRRRHRARRRVSRVVVALGQQAESRLHLRRRLARSGTQRSAVRRGFVFRSSKPTRCSA